MAIQLRSSSATRSWTHDVFLSFRGEDTRHNFTGHLHSNLVQKGINTFIDDELTRGEEISQALVQAIRGSKSSLIVFSENYASSKWCLDELVHILESKRSNQQQKVWPVFYKVDPSDVRHQRGSFGDALANHEHNFKGNRERVMKWRAALTETANLSGWHFSHGYESKFIDGIVEEIFAQVKEPIYLDVPKWSVGLDSRVQDMLKHLDVGESDIQMVGIWGIGGIGKTTIAKAVYNSIAHNFECSCFLANVRQESEVHGGLLNLQNILLSKIVRSKEFLKVINVDEGITLLRERLRHKRILLVLDDVNERNQLDKLVGATDWFGPGSRIIITTRDKHLLILHDVNPIKAKELDHDEACKLFSSFAFKNNKNLGDNEKLSVSIVVRYARGLPLALEVLGSHLRGRPIHQWQAELDGHTRDPNQDIQKILKISYDALEQKVKEVFLVIACFFKGWKKDDVIQILESYGSSPKTSIKILKEKALINVECGHISIHDLLEEMGKKIVHDEDSPKEPEERRRLSYHLDILQVLTKNTGTNKIEGINVKMPTTDEIRLNRECFIKMDNLKTFINVNARFYGKADYYPEQLKTLEWPEFPLPSLLSLHKMKELVQLNMLHSRFSSLGFKPWQNLISLNFSECNFLIEIPVMSGFPNLERLDLSGCRSLVEVHSSVGFLEKLVHVDLRKCFYLVKLPRTVNWRSLRHLNLNDCNSLESFPEIVGEMKWLTELRLFWCSAIKELPSSIGYLINLERLSLRNCENLTNLPFSIYQLQSLHEVELYECPKLKIIPNKGNSAVLMPTGKEDKVFNIRLNELTFDGCGSLSDNDLTDFLESLDCASTLESLNLSRSNIVSLSECLCKFICLRYLYLIGCRSLVEIPQLPPSIKYLDVQDCVSLERISKLSKILEGEESQMIEEMNLTNCCRLIENLVKEANVVVNEDYQAVQALFPFSLSFQKSKFTIKFPGREIPKWFSCQIDFQGLHQFEFCIEILPNFKWENTGLALCVLKDQSDYMFCEIEVFIYINEVEVLHLPSQYVYSRLDTVWLHYIPFLEMWRLHCEPPFMCRVIISLSQFSGCCGVHLVMPPNEDVCMKLSRAENRGIDEFCFVKESKRQKKSKRGRNMAAELTTKVRLVRCPKCWLLLPKLPGFQIRKCGGCGAVLQSKGQEKAELVPSELHSPIKQVQRVQENDEIEPSNVKEKVSIEEDKSSLEYLQGLFLFCFLFPSDFEFRKHELVQLWIAEGLNMKERKGETMEDAGIRHFDSLESTGFFVRSRCDFKVGFDSVFSVPMYSPSNFFYKVNPVELSALENRISHAKYFRAVNNELDGASESTTQHLSLTCDDIDEMTFGIIPKFKNLSTLLLLSGHGSSIKRVPGDLFLSLNFLTTLKLSRTLISGLPSSVGDVKPLRYLDVSYTPIRRLPESIGSLHNLQTLKLVGCKHLSDLPRSVQTLTALRHLDFDIIGQLDFMPAHLGNLTDLQTLSAFLVDKDDGRLIRELKNLNGLGGALRILRLENVLSKADAEVADLPRKKRLQRLDLRWTSLLVENIKLQEEILDSLRPHSGLTELQILFYNGTKLPAWLSRPSFTGLVVMTLYKCENCELLPSIGQLPELKFLSIVEMNKVKEINGTFFRSTDDQVDESFHAFPKLEILEVDIMLNLIGWKEVKEGDLPSLIKLTLESCPELVTLPSFSCLKCLKYFEVRCCRKLLSLDRNRLPTSLESLIIRDCPELKEWCDKEGDQDLGQLKSCESCGQSLA